MYIYYYLHVYVLQGVICAHMGVLSHLLISVMSLVQYSDLGIQIDLFPSAKMHYFALLALLSLS